ncbi:MAG: chemotaxis protein CheV [Oscillospiraceae bacterium]
MSYSKTNILLEDGHNDIEIIEFLIDKHVFAINVAKVKEILVDIDLIEIPNSNEYIEGVFKLRDEIITIIDLPKYLNIDYKKEEVEKNIFVVTHFNKMCIAFRTHKVETIHRVSWEDIKKPDQTIYDKNKVVATGMFTMGDKLITILDLEMIVAEIAIESTIQISEIDALGKREESDSLILIVEDSIVLQNLIKDSLDKAGYKNNIIFDDGQSAYDYIKSFDDINEISCVITDIEMPRMDGHRLTKLIKGDENLKKIPVLIFSSLISEDLYIRGRDLGADDHLAKPEIGKLVEKIDYILEIKSKNKF